MAQLMSDLGPQFETLEFEFLPLGATPSIQEECDRSKLGWRLGGYPGRRHWVRDRAKAKRCEILHHSIAVDPYGRPMASHMASYGSARVIAQCMTHGMTDFVPWAPPGSDDMYCPIGRIEQATEDGLAKIAAAIEEIL